MKNRQAFRIRGISIAVALACGCGVVGAHAQTLPSGAQVINGAASVSSQGGCMMITNTPGAIINWQSFSVGQSELVKFLQQSASSAVLNRVVGGQMSEILGRLQSNGQVFLINPAGILVGPGAAIDTAGFVASTLQMLDQDFLAGKLKFQGDAASGKITNQGFIRTGYGGHVVLIAPQVENSGIIQAPGGKILLAAGQKATISSLDLDGISFEVQAPADSVLNLGQLIADGGAVRMFAGTLKHSGNIRANALVRDLGGEIVLKAKSDISVDAGSMITANGGRGGSVRGLREREFTGDSGYAISFEAIAPAVIDALRPVMFLDHGYAKLTEPPALAALKEDESATSVGVGLRWNRQRTFDVTADLAYVLDGTTGTVTVPGTGRGNVKLNFSVFYRF